MMKKYLPHIFIALLLVSTTFFVLPHTAHAGDFIANTAAKAVSTFVNLSYTLLYKILNFLGYLALTIASWLLYLAGIVFNTAMNMTLTMSEFTKNSSAIAATWTAIRNFASMFFIFILLYASIMTILGKSNVRDLIAKIVVAGLLINFSLFFTKLAIDASNVITLGFYTAIAPDTSSADGGISDIFMQNLKVVTTFNSQGKSAQDALKGDFERKIFPALAGGAFVMFVAAGSFYVVAFILLVRIAVLLILMAFSPIYFVSDIIPNTKTYATEWLDTLVGQCLFPPIYLAFIYVVLKIITAPEFKNMIYNNSQTQSQSFMDAFMTGGSTGIIINYAIIIILLNAALAAAIKFSGASGKLAVEYANKTKSWIGRNTLGRGASRLNKKLENISISSGNKKFDTIANGLVGGNSATQRFIRGVTTDKLTNSKFGGTTSFKDAAKASKEADKKVKERQREMDAIKNIGLHIEANNSSGVKSELDKLTSTEIAKLDTKKILTHPLVLQHLDSKDFDQIDKSEKSDADKVKIKESRKKLIQDNISSPTPTSPVTIKNIIRNMSGSEVRDLGITLLTNPLVASNIKPSHLKDLEDMDTPDRMAFSGVISQGHPLYGSMHKPDKVGIWY